MMVDLTELEKRLQSGDFEESVLAIEESAKIIDRMTAAALVSLEKREDRFVHAEKLSALFYNYLIQLKEFLHSA